MAPVPYSVKYLLNTKIKTSKTMLVFLSTIFVQEGLAKKPFLQYTRLDVVASYLYREYLVFL